MNKLPFSPKEAAALQLLAKTEVAQQALQQIEQQRTEERRRILAEAKESEAKARKEEARLVAAIVRKRPEVDALRLKLLQAEAELRTLEAQASQAQFLAERVRNQAFWALLPLGGAILDETLRAARHAQAQARNLLRPPEAIRDYDGRLVESIDPNPTLTQRFKRMGELVAELEGLQLSELAPAEIEARCEQAQAEIADGAPVKPEYAPYVVPLAFH